MGKPQERDPSLHESKEERLSNLVMEFISKNISEYASCPG
jgi:hypothetical protein